MGKIKSWASKRQLQFKAMKIMVFDEADEMLKADGFADDSIRMIRDIKKQSPDCQVNMDEPTSQPSCPCPFVTILSLILLPSCSSLGSTSLRHHVVNSEQVPLNVVICSHVPPAELNPSRLHPATFRIRHSFTPSLPRV